MFYLNNDKDFPLNISLVKMAVCHICFICQYKAFSLVENIFDLTSPVLTSIKNSSFDNAPFLYHPLVQ